MIRRRHYIFWRINLACPSKFYAVYRSHVATDCLLDPILFGRHRPQHQLAGPRCGRPETHLAPRSVAPLRYTACFRQFQSRCLSLGSGDYLKQKRFARGSLDRILLALPGLVLVEELDVSRHMNLYLRWQPNSIGLRRLRVSDESSFDPFCENFSLLGDLSRMYTLASNFCRYLKLGRPPVHISKDVLVPRTFVGHRFLT